ncbi:MAG: hypothetical protein HYX28_00470 [Candidatus Koribacter versatilis]|uniref:Outer membrane protein beta-barrel domain-containing protein n=1 Tax=Candidatus Korobacter versatilis TaxID=658062 RepID=A0A932ENC2_9BACT|nr:hypothetical protein [Candidatus Koribacter versatilis]
MRKTGVLFLAAVVLAFVPTLFAQNHGEVGVFVDYTRLSPIETNNTGVGARVGFNVHKHVQLEAEMGYEFTQTFIEECTGCPLPAPIPEKSDLRILHALFGPKFQTGGDDAKARFFVTVKGGFTRIGISDRPVTFGNFFTSVEGLRANNVNGTLYPGVGAEFYLGPVGLRFDVGDEMIFFDSGRSDNLRITAGPHFRF